MQHVTEINIIYQSLIVHSQSIWVQIHIPHNVATLCFGVCRSNEETKFTGNMKAGPWHDKREAANFPTLSSASLKLRPPEEMCFSRLAAWKHCGSRGDFILMYVWYELNVGMALKQAGRNQKYVLSWSKFTSDSMLFICVLIGACGTLLMLHGTCLPDYVFVF